MNRTELETCDECGRDFRVWTAEDKEPVEDEEGEERVLCPACKDGEREDEEIYAGEKMPKSEASAEGWLADLIEEGTEGKVEAETFEARGVLTMNKGLVLRMPNGAEFQITIVRSR